MNRPVPHRLHKRIEDLTDKVVATEDPADLDHLIPQLQETLHEHSKRLRQLAANKLAKKPGDEHSA